jgi:hypothetical protein
VSESERPGTPNAWIVFAFEIIPRMRRSCVAGSGP